MALVGKACFELKLSQVNYSNGCIRIIYRHQPSPMVMSSIFKHFKLITFVILVSVQIIARPCNYRKSQLLTARIWVAFLCLISRSQFVAVFPTVLWRGVGTFS